MPETEVVLVLCAAALVAGWVDAVVGGGGLVQIPALLVLLPGATPAQVLATNKLSSVLGTATAAWVYVRRVRPDLRTALPMAVAALGGSAAGSGCASAARGTSPPRSAPPLRSGSTTASSGPAPVPCSSSRSSP